MKIINIDRPPASVAEYTSFTVVTGLANGSKISIFGKFVKKHFFQYCSYVHGLMSNIGVQWHTLTTRNITALAYISS